MFGRRSDSKCFGLRRQSEAATVLWAVAGAQSSTSAPVCSAATQSGVVLRLPSQSKNFLAGLFGSTETKRAVKTHGKSTSWISVVLALVIVVSLSLAANDTSPAEPSFQGKSLRQWLQILETTWQATTNGVASEPASETKRTREEVATALRGMGTNGLSYLVYLASLKPKPVSASARIGRPETRVLESLVLEAFRLLGTSGAPAIPDLAKLLDERRTSYIARECLHAIGQPAQPVFITSLTNLNQDVQGWALHEVGNLGPTASEAIPVLELLARDTNAWRAGNAQRVLSEVDTNAARLLPLFEASFANTDLVFDTAFALGRIGPSGARVLLQGLMGQNSRARTAAIAALQPHMTETSTNQDIQADRRFDYATCTFNGSALMAANASPPSDSGLVVPVIARNFRHAEPETRLALTRYAFQNYKLRSAPVLSQAAADESEEVRREADGAREALGVELQEGGVVRGSRRSKKMAFVFTGHSFAESGDTIQNELLRRKAKASFFFTGEFCANTNFAPLVLRAVKDGHYIGPHSDRHLLYCPWSGPKTSLVSRMEFAADLHSNLEKITAFESERRMVRFFLPPYEHYNQEIAEWSAWLGMTLVNFTPGTRSNADYTGEADTNFVSSQAIFDSILRREREDPHGLNGFILLLHIGSGPGRADKFHSRFGELLDALAAKGYQFVRVDELLEPKEAPESRSP